MRRHPRAQTADRVNDHNITPPIRVGMHGGVGFELEARNKLKTQYESDTYEFNLQRVNSSLDCLLLLVVRSLVWSASTILNECDRRSQGNRGRGRFRGSRGTVSVGGGFWFFGLRILGGSSFGFGGGSHRRGDQRRGEDVGPLYAGALYVRACDVEEYE